MGRAIMEEKDIKTELHWLKKLTGVGDLENAIILGFHRIDTAGEWDPTQRRLVDIRDMYLRKFDGKIKTDLVGLYATI